MDRVLMLTRLAMRSMLSHRVKNAIVGIIMIFGTMLVVVGTSILDSVEYSMQQSITASATGHIQVYSSDADDELAIFGGMGGGAMDIGEIDDFQSTAQELQKLSGVRAVVPMGIGNAVSFGRSEIDRVLDGLHESVRSGAGITEEQKKQVLQIASLMKTENRNRAGISTDLEGLEEELAIIDKVLDEAFWKDPLTTVEEKLEYLDTRFAPLSTEGRLLYLRYLATDPELFYDSFDRFQIVDGEPIPKGTRGILFSKRFYEKQVKSRVAREFDAIMKEVDEGTRIAKDEVLRNRIKRMSRMASAVAYQLDTEETELLKGKLSALLPEASGSIESYISTFLFVDDQSVRPHYEFFYAEIAPLIDVYDVSVGDEMVLQAFTKSGYAKSAKVKIYGTFNFKGLETSDLAGAINVMDLVTFRTLYGKMSEEQKQELAEIREEAGVKEIAAENIEDALFGDGSDSAIEEASNGEGDDFEIQIDREAAQNGQKTTYSAEELREGVVLNAAVILDNDSKAAVEQTIANINALSKEKDLKLQAIDWQKASGIVGQFILVISLVLYTAIVIIFTVALVIINNSMVMATMERIPEIGTLRAIGAQKSTIMLLTLLETTVLCTISGVIGAAAGAGLIAILGSSGIPASNDVMVFLFGGPALYPAFGASNLILGFVIIMIVSLLSTVYPALLANRVQPVVAMRGKD
jgi:ABC-type lipoprotein release transport system permease subunit